MTPARPSRLAVLLLSLAATRAAVAEPPAAAASDGGERWRRCALLEDNDAFAVPHTDRWYTQGLELRCASPAGSRLREPGAAATSVEDEYFIGQQLFTPVNLAAYPPDPTDRPYAGWLYLGRGLAHDDDGRHLDHLEVELGVVGPAALGRQTQEAFHALSNQISPRAWDHQLRNEPGLVASYERRWRVTLIDAGVGAELIPELGASLGNVYDYAAAGALVRVGRGLGADYGVSHPRPAPSGTGWFNPRLAGAGDWSVFVGTEVRAVARDLFLDGNTWQASASVARRPAVADLVAGGALRWHRWQLDAAWIWRTREFDTQATTDRYGSIGLRATF